MRTIAPQIDLVVDARNHVGETPVWSQAESALYWVNCEDPPELLRWEPKSGEVRRWSMPERIGGFVLKKSGGALVVLASGLFDFDFSSGELSLRVPSPVSGPVALHESAMDPTGRFWVGSIDQRIGPENLNPGGGKLFRLDGDTLVPVLDGISCANGLAFSPDGSRLYFSDSPTGRCDQWQLDPRTSALGERKTLFALGPGEGFVDGATVDAEGAYWATIVYGSALRRYRSDGSLDLTVQLPFKNPTKVAFGGADWKTLYITTTSMGIGERTTAASDGGLFAFEPGFAGNPEIFFPA